MFLIISVVIVKKFNHSALVDNLTKYFSDKEIVITKRKAQKKREYERKMLKKGLKIGKYTENSDSKNKEGEEMIFMSRNVKNLINL